METQSPQVKPETAKRLEEVTESALHEDNSSGRFSMDADETTPEGQFEAFLRDIVGTLVKESKLPLHVQAAKDIFSQVMAFEGATLTEMPDAKIALIARNCLQAGHVFAVEHKLSQLKLSEAASGERLLDNSRKSQQNVVAHVQLKCPCCEKITEWARDDEGVYTWRWTR